MSPIRDALVEMTLSRPTPTDDLGLSHDRVTRTVYATDNSIYQVAPARVGVPTSAAQIAELLRANRLLAMPQPVVARGGGTGTNGQSLTSGLVLDLKRGMNRIGPVDVAARTVVVEPGVVTAALNATLAEHGLFWPPHTSTLNRATVGGMISTDAAGKGSLIHGRAHRHVERLEMLLDDGTEWVAEPVSESEAQRRAAAGGRGGALWQALLDVPVADAATLGLPELARGFSGYGIDRLRRDNLVDPVALVCGAEGTLGVVTRAVLKLSPLPGVARLVVASYDTFGDALEDAVELRGTSPLAIESFDETTLERGRSSPAWPALGAAIGDHLGAVLLLEYTDDAAADLAGVQAAIAATGRSRSLHVIDDPSVQAQVWKVRADAVGLLAKVAVGGPDLEARPTAFVEDCAVPVAEMPAFIASFRSVLDQAGLQYGMFGHADVGCVHVRPALDLTAPGQRELVAQITRKVIDLVSEHHGIVWGEHGRGYRGAHVDELLSPATVRVMRQVKSAFDPADIFNPGKLYRPLESQDAIVDVGEPSMRGSFDAEVPVSVRRSFGSAFACNGNGLCHHYSVDEVMCPSFKASGDPALSPKGRADLIRAWLRDQGNDPQFEHAIADNLNQCLSCSACSGRCPVEVDIPELKSQFFDEYYQARRRPLSHYAMSRFEQLAMFGARFPRVTRRGLRPAERLLGLVDLPAPKQGQEAPRPPFTGEPGFDVVVMPDVFTAALDPTTLRATLRVLESVGYSVAVAGFVGSGKFDHVKGRRRQFVTAVRRQAAMVKQITAAGSLPVVIEPAVALLHSNEYRTIVGGYPSDAVRSLADLITERADRLPLVGAGAGVKLLGHCTERAIAPNRAEQWCTVLEAAGYSVNAPAIGCCGMAGIFGHEVGNQQMSKRLWELSWAAHVGGPQTAVATGYSCRSQAARFGAVKISHPIELLLHDSGTPSLP